MTLSTQCAALLDRLSGVTPTLLTMTLAATVAALVVMVLRLVLGKAPRKYMLFLWIMVLVRMFSPFGYGQGFVSLIPEAVSSGRAAEVILEAGGVESVSPAEPVYQTADLPANGDGALAGPMPAAEATNSGGEKHAPPPITPGRLIPVIWLAGTAGMLLWSAAEYVKVRRRVAEAVRTAWWDYGDIYESDAIDAPFVLGSNIYLPMGLDGEDRKYVLLHEQAHVERYDAVFKAVAWIALSLHWFNPVLWLAYRLLCRDVETVCDQMVIDGFEPETRRENVAGYAAALLHLGRRERLPQAVLPFGEENARGRIKNILAYRKPAKWAAVLAVALCAAVGMLIVFNGPAKAQEVEFAGTTIQFADAYEVLFTIEDGPPGQRVFSLPFALTEEMAAVLKGAECRTYHDRESMGQDPALAGWDGREEKLMGDIWEVQCYGADGRGGFLYGWGNGTVLWADSDHDTYLLYPDLKDSAAFQTWAAHVNQCMTTDWAEEMYDLSEEGTALRQIDRSPRGVLFYTGIRYVYPTSYEAVITLEDRTLTVRIQEAAPYTDPVIFEQVFDQYLREASLRTIALVDTIDEVAYVYPDGTPGPSVTLILEKKPTREEFADLYVNGFDSLGMTASPGETVYPAAGLPPLPEEDQPVRPPAKTAGRTSAEPAAPSSAGTADRGTGNAAQDPADALSALQTNVRRAGPGRDPAAEVRALFLAAGAGQYLNEENALVYVQNNEIKVLLTEDVLMDDETLTRAANRTVDLTDGADTLRVYDREGAILVETFGRYEAMEQEEFLGAVREERVQPRPDPAEERAEPAPEPVTSPAPQEPGPLPDSLNLDFTQQEGAE